MNPKSLSRLIAVQTMYMMVIKNNPPYSQILEEIFYLYEQHCFYHEYEELSEFNNELKYKKKFVESIVNYTCTNFEIIKTDIINMLHRDQSIQNISIITQAILFTALTELKYFPTTPWKVITNDYTNIASDFLNEKEIGLVNSILHQYHLQYNTKVIQ